VSVAPAGIGGRGRGGERGHGGERNRYQTRSSQNLLNHRQVLCVPDKDLDPFVSDSINLLQAGQ
jgi:hypothetical protein